jgi:hypothetical protein
MIFALGGLAASLLVPMPAAAQNTQSWVASTGSDANDCSRASPCASLSRALDQTDAGGRIDCADRLVIVEPTPVTIDKSITIDCEGGVLRNSAGLYLVEVAAGANDVVRIRGLNFYGIATGGPRIPRGLYLDGSGAEVHVDRARFDHFLGFGIATSSGSNRLFVTDTVVSDSSSSGCTTGSITTASGTEAVLTRVTVEGADLRGVLVAAGSLTVRDSVISGNGTEGIRNVGGTVVLEEVQIAGNGVGLRVERADGPIVASDTRITGNGTGILSSGGGQVLSGGGNVLIGNGSDGAFTGTVSAQ